jgi:hypothetical protein
VVLDAYTNPTAGRYVDALAFVAWLDDLAARFEAEAKRRNLSERVAE